MTETQRKILRDIVDDFLSMSLEEIKAYSEEIHFNDDPFGTLQEMSDAIESSDEYQELICRETLGSLKDETLGLKINRNMTYNTVEPVKYSFSENVNEYSYKDDGGMPWAA